MISSAKANIDIVHGDMKPENVLIFKNNQRYTAKVTDFGLSIRSTDQDHLVKVIGSRLWTAPELDLNYLYFSGDVPLPAESCQIEQFFESEQQQTLSMVVIERLKHGTELNLLAKMLVRNEQSIDDSEVQILEGFFDKALSCDPEDRLDALEVLFPFKKQ
jgi:serine/threonine protein kinase